MEKLGKADLLKVVEEQRAKITKYERKVKEVIAAYKSILEEKKALEATLRVLNSSKLQTSQTPPAGQFDKLQDSKPETPQHLPEEGTDIATAPGENENDVSPKISEHGNEKSQNSEAPTVEFLQVQLATLTNSLSTLSFEKSRMEAAFQADKRQLRQEREKRDETIRELQEKLENVTRQHRSELAAVRAKLSTERREREKEQNNHAEMLRELQKITTDERQAKENLEAQILELRAKATLAEQKTSDQQDAEIRLLHTMNELEATRSRLRSSETSARQTSPVLLQLRAEISELKQQHIVAIQEEQSRAAEAEERAKRLAAVHEERVANLESRLAELSATVGSYDRLRQQDQLSIHRLKEHIAQLAAESPGQNGEQDEAKDVSEVENDQNLGVDVLLRRLLSLREQLITANQRSEKPVDIDAVLFAHCGDVSRHFDLHRTCREEAEQLRQEIQKLKQKQKEIPQFASHHTRSKEGAEAEMLKVQVRSLQERVRMLNGQLEHAERTEHDLHTQLDHTQQQLKLEQASWREKVSALEAELRARGLQLEQQLSLQRERSLALLEDKEQEIRMLKNSFRKLLAPKSQSFDETDDGNIPRSASFEDLSGQETRVLQDETKTEKNSSDIQVDSLSGILLGSLGSAVNTSGVPGSDTESPHILHYAHELARRDVDITNLRKAKYRLECSVREMQKLMAMEQSKHTEEVLSLKGAVERLERCQSREGANLEYLKNVVMSFLVSNSPSSKRHMLNAIAAVLRFSDAEVEKVSRHSSNSWWYYSQ